VRLRRRPARPQLEQIWSSNTEDDERNIPRERCDVLDQLEQRGLSPVDVVEDDDQRLLAC
jgi:hypothetical protein